MKSLLAALGVAALVTAGCQTATVPAATKPTASAPPPIVPTRTGVTAVSAPPVVAIVEPYLVPMAASPVPPPTTLRGSLGPMPTVPVIPLPPVTGSPVDPPSTHPPSAPNPPVSKPLPIAPPSKRTPTLPPAVVKLFEDERAHSVDDARRRLSAATARAVTASAEAKRQWGFVKSGFVAQKQAENADAAAKDALDEQSDAQKALDDAQQRQRNARRDIEAALRVAETPSPFALIQLETPVRSYQPVPGLYRLSVLGSSPTTISVQNGILGRRLPLDGGEAGAWIVRCPDPLLLRVGVGSRPATLVIRTLPSPNEKPKA